MQRKRPKEKGPNGEPREPPDEMPDDGQNMTVVAFVLR